MQGVPIVMSGRDIIGIAKTGSGKTAAFLWPLLVHIMDQKEIKPGEGPIGLICAPTRELSQQVIPPYPTGPYWLFNCRLILQPLCLYQLNNHFMLPEAFI